MDIEGIIVTVLWICMIVSLYLGTKKAQKIYDSASQEDKELLSMIALMEPPMIAVMGPFQNGQKAVLGPASNYGFSPPFKVSFLSFFLMVELTFEESGFGDR